MKAMVLHSPAPIGTNPLSYEDVEMPAPASGEIIIKVGACGVCRSNLQVIEGERGTPPKLPLIPGHEVVGIVTELGSGITSLNIGDRVGAQPQFSVCGSCDLCISGRENLCQSAKRLGWSADGGYSQYMKGFAAHVHKVPDGLGDAQAAPLFCPGVTAYSAVKSSRPFPGKRIAVFGIGGVGHMAVQFAKLYGADVIAVSRNPLHTKLAEELGADSVILSSGEDPAAALARRGKVDSSIVFAPSDQAVSQAIAATKKGGIIVLGVDCNIKGYSFMNGHTIVSSVVGTRKEINEVLELASRGLVSVKAREMKLAQANEALCAMKENGVEGRIVLKP